MGYESEPANPERERGSLFRLDVDGSLHSCLNKINISNGLAWTADNKTMYYIDSLPRKVYGFDYDIETGNISTHCSTYITTDKLLNTCKRPHLLLYIFILFV